LSGECHSWHGCEIHWMIVRVLNLDFLHNVNFEKPEKKLSTWNIL